MLLFKIKLAAANKEITPNPININNNKSESIFSCSIIVLRIGRRNILTKKYPKTPKINQIIIITQRYKFINKKQKKSERFFTSSTFFVKTI